MHGDRFVTIALHTSNWDAIISILLSIRDGWSAVYVIKDTWLSLPVIGSVLRALGFICKPAGSRGSMTAELIKHLRASPGGRFRFVIMPEGQRSYGGGWRSGYYYIARETGAKIEIVVIDFHARTMEIEYPPIDPSDMSLEETNSICMKRLARSSVPLYPEHAYPAPHCATTAGDAVRCKTGAIYINRLPVAIMITIIVIVFLALTLPYMLLVGAPAILALKSRQ
jgi:1-acyl-sn-glycerol-3-phosphate acyltransferase